MSQNIISPSVEDPKYTSVFLAGGITNCKNWQEEVIKELNDIEKLTTIDPEFYNAVRVFLDSTV